MRSSQLQSLLFSIFLISSTLVIIIDCSTCKQKHRNSANDVNETKSFKNLNGSALEEAVLDEIAQQQNNKINSQIHLRHLGISRITRNMLRNISSIYSIDFQHNEITEIENESFSSNEKLEKIDLMENHLTKITKHIFSGNFHELQEINLSFNAINAIESGSFDGFVNLVSIDMSSNCITHLHSDLFKKSSELRQVYVNNNRITKIGTSLFRQKTSLNVLDLSHNNLEILPEIKIKSIKHLDVSHNKIKILNLNHESSHERRNLAHIEELSVANNAIIKCVEISKMRNDIICLDMSHNQINDMNDLPVLLNMKILQLSHNNLSNLSVRKIHEHFPSLRSLNISGNNIDCDKFNSLRSKISRMAIFIDANCSNISSSPLSHNFDYETNAMDIIQSYNHEIVRQLKLNRNFLIILLSILIVLLITPITFLLYRHLRYDSIKYIRNERLIEQIEL